MAITRWNSSRKGPSSWRDARWSTHMQTWMRRCGYTSNTRENERGRTMTHSLVMDYEGKSRNSVLLVALVRPSLFKTARFRSYIRRLLSLSIFARLFFFFPSAPTIFPLSNDALSYKWNGQAWTNASHCSELVLRRYWPWSRSAFPSKKVRIALATLVSFKMIFRRRCNFLGCGRNTGDYGSLSDKVNIFLPEG